MSEKMLFCLGEGKYVNQGEGYQKNYRVFNTDVSIDDYNEVINSRPEFKLPVSVWVDKKDMTDEEKKKYGIIQCA